MKKLKTIRIFMVAAKMLLLAGVILVTLFITALPKGVYLPIRGNTLEITSEVFTDTIYHKPFFDERPDLKGKSYLVPQVKTSEIKMKLDNSLKIVLTLLAVLASAYTFWILELFTRIIKSVERQNSFNKKNVNRVKIAGVLIMISPLFEWSLRMVFRLYIENIVTIENAQVKVSSDFGLSTAIVGMLIIVLGVAFEQGSNIQRENELTV